MSQRGFGVTGDESQPEPPGGGEEQPRFPRYVRVLAVAYVLSFAVQPIGFLLLTGTATFLYGRRREIDGWVLGLGLGGGVLMVLCSVFRWWFPRWGRKHWPPDGRT